MTQQLLDLNGAWNLAYGPQQPGASHPYPPDGFAVIPATVPGNVELDLMAAGVLPDLTVGNNIYLLRGYEGYEWWYWREFIVPPVAEGQSSVLVFEGLDCIGDVWLDDAHIGHTDNMLIAHSFDITRYLSESKTASHRLTVRISSAVLAGRTALIDPLCSAFSTNWESLTVRKAPHMYGWDIMPRLVSAGLWRSVHVDVLPATHFRSVYFATMSVDNTKGSAVVLVDWDFVTDLINTDHLTIRLNIAGTQHECAALGTHGRMKVELDNVDYWYPRGYGQPHLYTAELALCDSSGNVLDKHYERIGIRIVELRRTDITLPDAPGEFVFIVNGEKVFVKGTNWVPLDALHSRDVTHLPQAMQMLSDLNCNMVRCWGGNVYEDHAFFTACDELGIMVWQDFALACAIYPQTDAFADQIGAEAESVIQKLRNHPSLVLWAGNNEIDEAYAWSGAGIDPNTDRLSRHVLPVIARRCDPFRPYIPSSPYRSPQFVKTQQEIEKTGQAINCQPEQHLWGPRNDFKSDFYTGSIAHFASEIGYHGCPDRRSMEQFIEPEYLWSWQNNEQWLTHATRPHPAMQDWNYRIELMAKQISVLFDKVPDNIDDFVLASQISQAEAKKFFIEWFRQAKWRRTGILWWNLRDGWAIISDAVVDYYGRKKLAYEYIKRSQSPLCALCWEPVNGKYPVRVVNDTLKDLDAHITVHDLESRKLLMEQTVHVERNGSDIVGYVEAVDIKGMFDVNLITKDMPMRNHYLYGERPYDLSRYRYWLSLLEIPEDVGPVRHSHT